MDPSSKAAPARAEAAPQGRLAHIYACRALDVVVQVAEAVAHDFLKRPANYRGVPDAIAEHLADFRSLPGSQAEWPSVGQRTAIASGALRRFYTDLAGLRKSAIVVSERSSGQGEGVLRAVFLDHALRLRAAMGAIEGQALETGERQARTVVERAEAVLTCEEVARAFGLPPVPSGGWPDGGLYSQEAAYLCDAVARASRRRKQGVRVSQARFAVFQRVAHYGAATIAGLGNPSLAEDNDSLERLMTHAYCWAGALQDLLSRVDIVRAWTDPEYRSRLQVVEQDLMPGHPAGEIDLSDTSLRAVTRPITITPVPLDTITVAGEVCCSSGDLCHTNGICTSVDIDDCEPTNTRQCEPIPV